MKNLSDRTSVRPNTEYSAEYSAKTYRIFGTEYSAKSADTPITENAEKWPFLTNFSSNFGQILGIHVLQIHALSFTFQLS